MLDEFPIVANRRQFITGVAGVSAVRIAGCSASEETETAEEELSVVLPPDSSELFAGAKLTNMILPRVHLSKTEWGQPRTNLI